MRSRITLTALLTIAFSLRLLQVRAAACAEICYTTELTGFGPGGTAGCTCSGTRQGARVGTDSCSCGQCYQATGAGIVGYAISSDNTCSFGTNCGDCDYTPDDTSTTTPSTLTPSSMPPPPTSFRPSTNTTDAPTTAPPTAMPTLSSTATSGTSSLTSDLSDSSTASPTNTNSPDVNNSNNSDPATKRGTASSKGLETWQIALIIFCGLLVFIVAVVSVLSCYCKARSRLFENEDDQPDVSYYQQPQHNIRENTFVSSVATAPTLVRPPLLPHGRRSGSLGSFTNECKPGDTNASNSGTADRLNVGLVPVFSLENSTRLTGSFPNERILSGSSLNDCRPSHSNKSFIRQLSLENGRALAVEL